jgi:hypothetical protein
MSPLFFGLRPFQNVLCFRDFKWPYFLGFVPSRMIYASTVLSEPLAFWVSSLPKCFMLLEFWLVEPMRYWWARFAHGSKLLGLRPIEYWSNLVRYFDARGRFEHSFGENQSLCLCFGLQELHLIKNLTPSQAVVPDFASKTKYSSYVCPRIIYSTHTDIKCPQITKCQK